MVAPLIWIGWTAGAAIAASLTSCDGTPEKEDIHDIVTMDDISSTDIADAPTPKDSFTETTTHTPTSQCPSFPLKGTVILFATSPCGKDAFINDIDEDGWGSCTNMGDKSYLFHTGKTGIDQMRQLSNTPDQIVTGSQLFYSGQNKDQWGFGAWSVGSSTQDQWTSLPALSSGMPSFAKGIDFVNGKVFVVSSNVSFAKGSAEYQPGTVFAFDGAFKPTATITTTQINPTSIGHFEQGGITYLAVIGSGPLDGKDTKSQLDIIDPTTLKIIQSVQLPFGGLGIGGEIAIAGGRMAIGSADNSGRIVVLNTQDLKTAPLILTVPEAIEKSGFHFISMTRLTPDGKFLIAGNYNSGKISVWELGAESSNLAKQSIPLDKNMMDASGIGDAACINGKFMVSLGTQIMAVE